MGLYLSTDCAKPVSAQTIGFADANLEPVIGKSRAAVSRIEWPD